MPVAIHKVVVHRPVKDQHQPIQQSQMRDAVVGRGNEHIQKLIDSLVAVYGTRYNTAQYGGFNEGPGRGTFPDAFERYTGSWGGGPDHDGWPGRAPVAPARDRRGVLPASCGSPQSAVSA